MSQQNPDQFDPYAKDEGSGTPPTSPYGTPQQPPADPYGTAPQPPYGQQPYGQAYQQQASYQQPGQPYGQSPYTPQAPPYGVQAYDPQAKSRLAAGLLGIFLGAFGIHRFYTGYTGLGLTMLLISVLSFGFLAWAVGIWGLVEGILYLTDKTGNYSRDRSGRPLRD